MVVQPLFHKEKEVFEIDLHVLGLAFQFQLDS